MDFIKNKCRIKKRTVKGYTKISKALKDKKKTKIRIEWDINFIVLLIYI